MNKNILIALLFSLVSLHANAEEDSDVKDLKKRINKSVLVKMSHKLNTELPINIDDDTRWDSTKAGPGYKFTYFYTTVNSNYSDININEFKSEVKKRHALHACDYDIIKVGVFVSHVYHSKDKKFIAQADINPKDCGY